MTTRATYPSYKPSGIDWLGDIPNHWEVRKLKQSAELVRDVVDASVAHRPYVGLEHVQSATGQFLGEMDSAEVAGLALEVSPGDVIFGKLRPYLAKVALVPREIVTSTEFFALKSYSTTPEYLQRLLISAGFIDLVDSSTYGAKMPRANWDFVGNTFIPLPPLDEQRAIADYLDRKDDEITRFIESRRRMIALLEEKKHAIINQAVTRGLDPSVPMKDSGVEWLGEIPAHWETPALRYLGTKFGSGLTPRGGATTYLSRGVMFLRSQNIHFDGLRTEDVAFISEEIHAAMENSRVRPNDVLINITGASLGRVTYVPDDFDTANVNQHVAIVRPMLSNILPAFVARFLSTSVVQDQIQQLSAGAAREGLAMDELKSIPVALPDKAEQQEIIDHISYLDKLMTDQTVKFEREIELMQEYRTRLISDVVTGKVKVG